MIWAGMVHRVLPGSDQPEAAPVQFFSRILCAPTEEETIITAPNNTASPSGSRNFESGRDCRTSRHTFLAASLAASIIGRHVLGGPGHQAPSDTLRIAAVGVGGMGRSQQRHYGGLTESGTRYLSRRMGRTFGPGTFRWAIALRFGLTFAPGVVT